MGQNQATFQIWLYTKSNSVFFLKSSFTIINKCLNFKALLLFYSLQCRTYCINWIQCVPFRVCGVLSAFLYGTRHSDHADRKHVSAKMYLPSCTTNVRLHWCHWNHTHCRTPGGPLRYVGVHMQDQRISYRRVFFIIKAKNTHTQILVMMQKSPLNKDFVSNSIP